MKRIYFLLAFFLLSYAGAYAQFSIIPKAGITLSTVAFEDEPEGLTSNLGFVAGAGFEIPIIADGFLAFQPELLYIQKGAQYEDDALNLDVKNYLNYLELPLLLKVNFGSDDLKLFALAGPSLGYLAGSRIKFGDEDSESVSLDDDDNRLDIGVQFGVCAGYTLGPGALTLEARYGLGLTNTVDDFDSKNRVIALLLGYAIPLGN